MVKIILPPTQKGERGLFGMRVFQKTVILFPERCNNVTERKWPRILI
jgi:hypothetical protein